MAEMAEMAKKEETAELGNISQKLQMLVNQHEQVNAENKELIIKLEQFRNENEILKCELEAMYEKLKMINTPEPIYERNYPIKCGRIIPYDAFPSIELVDDERGQKKGGKKTSL